MNNRIALRYGAALIAGVVAVLYFLIAAGTIVVLTDQAQSGDGVIPAVAGVAYAVLAVLLALTGKRSLLIAGAALALFTILGYFVVAPNRTPQFEAWGIAIKVLQAAIALGLGYLGLTKPGTEIGKPRAA